MKLRPVRQRWRLLMLHRTKLVIGLAVVSLLAFVAGITSVAAGAATLSAMLVVDGARPQQ